MQKPGIKRVCGRTKEVQCGWTLEGRMEEVLQDETVGGEGGDQTAFGLACVLSRVQLFATPWTVVCQAPLSMDISHARILEWVAISYSRGSSRPRIKSASLMSPALAGRFLTTEITYMNHSTYSLEEPLKSLYSVLRMHHSAASLTCNHYISSPCPKWAVFTSLVICTSLSQ